MAGTAASGRVTIQVLCLLDIQVRVRVFVGRPVVDVEETLIAAKVARRKTDTLNRVETVTGILPVRGQRATYFKPVWCRLRRANEDILQGQRPMTGYRVGLGIAATGYKSQAPALYVGQHAVDHQVP